MNGSLEGREKPGHRHGSVGSSWKGKCEAVDWRCDGIASLEVHREIPRDCEAVKLSADVQHREFNFAIEGQRKAQRHDDVVGKNRHVLDVHIRHLKKLFCEKFEFSSSQIH